MIARATTLVLVAALCVASPAGATHVTAEMLQTARSCTGYRGASADGSTAGMLWYAVPVPGAPHDAVVTGTITVAGASASQQATVGADHVVYMEHTAPSNYVYSYAVADEVKTFGAGTISVEPGIDAGCDEERLARLVAADARKWNERIREQGAGAAGRPPTGDTTRTGAGGLDPRDRDWGYVVTSELDPAKLTIEARPARNEPAGPSRWVTVMTTLFAAIGGAIAGLVLPGVRRQR